MDRSERAARAGARRLPRLRDEQTMALPAFLALVDECWQLIKMDAREALVDG